MDLDAEHLVHYLVERGLLDLSEVVDGGLMVAESSRRHRSFRVLRPRGGGLFVKQVRQPDAETVTTFQREGACYWLAANDAAFAPLRDLMPRFLDYDKERLALVTDLLPQAEDLTRLHQRLGTFPTELAGQLGEALGSFQAAMAVEGFDPRYSAFFPRALPWPLICRRVSVETFSRHGAEAGAVVSAIHADPVLAQSLDALAEEYRPGTLIHGDIKWDNLLSHPNGSPEHSCLKL
ncbi:MAG: phosphotransferase, partial [Acidobacteria bacterium]|nr:phosphotransferase [Acidobacteriota bacterium]